MFETAKTGLRLQINIPVQNCKILPVYVDRSMHNSFTLYFFYIPYCWSNRVLQLIDKTPYTVLLLYFLQSRKIKKYFLEASCMKEGIIPNYLLIFYICFASFFSLSGKPVLAAENSCPIQIMEKEILGKYLADSTGITLYAFEKDEKDSSNCIEGCAANWPPFCIDPAAAIAGCDSFESGDFATITRSDGLPQTTYKGMPLYYFKNDKYPGDTFGNGIGDVWFLVTP